MLRRAVLCARSVPLALPRSSGVGFEVDLRFDFEVGGWIVSGEEELPSSSSMSSSSSSSSSRAEEGEVEDACMDVKSNEARRES